jgi:hypothetical protein
VQRALEADIREIQGLVRTLEADLVRFQDIPTFKRSLRDMDLREPTEFRRRRGTDRP